MLFLIFPRSLFLLLVEESEGKSFPLGGKVSNPFGSFLNQEQNVVHCNLQLRISCPKTVYSLVLKNQESSGLESLNYNDLFTRVSLLFILTLSPLIDHSHLSPPLVTGQDPTHRLCGRVGHHARDPTQPIYVPKDNSVTHGDSTHCSAKNQAVQITPIANLIVELL